MNIRVLSRNPRLYSTRRLVEAGLERGHDTGVIDTLRCYMEVTTKEPKVYFDGQPLRGVDAVVPRIGVSVTFYGTAVLYEFELQGVYALNSSRAIQRARDKLRAMQIMAREGIQLPITGYCGSTEDIENVIRMVKGPPVIIKSLQGTQGIGVVLAETRKAARSAIEAFMQLKNRVLVQEYIGEAEGKDVRCFVVGERVVGAMERSAVGDEFRSNLHRGGKAEPTRLSSAEDEVVRHAVRALGLGVAGVDLLRSERGPLVLEVNPSPGLEGIERATGKDIAGEIIRLIERNVDGTTDRTAP